ncbi:MAG: hypothetical protein NT180_06065 [Actinobacteria bacterium]|nr:hypothetical protein [Actinomycetota bacterium]
MGLQTSGMDTAHHVAGAPAKTCGPDSTHPRLAAPGLLDSYYPAQRLWPIENLTN